MSVPFASPDETFGLVVAIGVLDWFSSIGQDNPWLCCLGKPSRANICCHSYLEMAKTALQLREARGCRFGQKYYDPRRRLKHDEHDPSSRFGGR
jgi:hypothetical protein